MRKNIFSFCFIRVVGIAGTVGWMSLAGCLTACKTSEQAAVKPSSKSGYVKRTDESYRVVVFVHGIFGDQQSTWRNGNNPTWPEMMAKDSTFKTFDIFSVGFDSPFTGTTSNIVEVASQVREQLFRNGVFKYPEVYFVTHSMGGLITKRVLVDLNTCAEDDNLRKVKAVLFYSTPAQGAPIADLARWLSANPQLSDMKPADVNTFLQGLEWQWLALMRERDTQNKTFPLAYGAYETKPMGTVIVPSMYATSRFDNVPPRPFDLNHLQIVKPASTQDEIYDWARERIFEAADKINMHQRGQEEGRAIGIIMTRLKRYNVAYAQYPTNLSLLEVEEQIRIIGKTRLAYQLDPAHGFTLRMAGEDRRLNTLDDMIEYGRP